MESGKFNFEVSEIVSEDVKELLEEDFEDCFETIDETSWSFHDKLDLKHAIEILLESNIISENDIVSSDI